MEDSERTISRGQRMDEALATREKNVEEAKKLPFLDAVFLVCYFNYRPYFYFRHCIDQIRIDEIFDCVDEIEYRDALDRIEKMTKSAVYVAESHLGYSEARPISESLARFYADNPGFSKCSYEKAIFSAMTAMR